MRTYIKYLFAGAALFSFTGCEDNEGGSHIDTELNAEIIEAFSEHVAQATYNDLKSKASQLNDNILALAAEGGQTAEKLEACRNSWKAARQAWEQTESFLFGPVSTDDVDPRIDTWPVDFNALEDILASEDEFTEAFINNLQEGEKGFHAIEYLIFGENGSVTAAELSLRELEF